MSVYCVKDERGWLFKEQPVPPISGAPEGEDALALAVYLTEEDAFEDAASDPEGSGSVVQMRSPEVITQALEEGRFQYVRVRWPDDDEEDSVCALDGWHYAVDRGLVD